MKIQVLLTLVLLIAQRSKCNDTCPTFLPLPAPVPLIVNGHVASPGVRNYLVSINAVEGGSYCSGSLIASRWVLSAAHCFIFGESQPPVYNNSFILLGVDGVEKVSGEKSLELFVTKNTTMQDSLKMIFV